MKFFCVLPQDVELAVLLKYVLKTLPDIPNQSETSLKNVLPYLEPSQYLFSLGQHSLVQDCNLLQSLFIFILDVNFTLVDTY